MEDGFVGHLREAGVGMRVANLMFAMVPIEIG